jgi:hypothetical protein
MHWHVPYRRLRAAAAAFLLLAAGFALTAAALHRWGPAWSRAAYAPLLRERVEQARARDWYWKTEQLLVRAVRETPAYARYVHELAGGDLRVMPELRDQLEAATRARVEPAGTGLARQEALRQIEARLGGAPSLTPREAYLLATALRGLHGLAPVTLMREGLDDPVARSAACEWLGHVAQLNGDTRGAAVWYARALRGEAPHDASLVPNRNAAAALAAFAERQGVHDKVLP